jgi:hypothetical protein
LFKYCLDIVFFICIKMVSRKQLNDQLCYYKKKLNKQVQHYKNDLQKYKTALQCIDEINHIDINNALNRSVEKSVSIMEHWEIMKEEFNKRINLINATVVSLREVIKNNNYTELKTWALKEVTWSDQFPNSILIKYINENIVKIQIKVENFMMLGNVNLSNCYIVAKSSNSNKWNLYGEYNKDMHCFSTNYAK